MAIFNDKYEQETAPAMDYPFASDFYPERDCRYPLTEQYKASVQDKIGIAPYNCKISIPRMGNGIYNVYLYFRDIREVFTPEEHKKFWEDSIIHNKESCFTRLFLDVTRQCPLPQLHGRALNPNGVFVEDFRARSLAYTAAEAEAELKQLWAAMCPQIVYTTIWDSSLYLFFHTIDALNRFAEYDAGELKERSCRVMKKYDKDGFCSMEAFSIMLDLLENYKSIGGHNYFNSDAMDGLQAI